MAGNTVKTLAKSKTTEGSECLGRARRARKIWFRARYAPFRVTGSQPSYIKVQIVPIGGRMRNK
jgi:hypothetical protein